MKIKSYVSLALAAASIGSVLSLSSTQVHAKSLPGYNSSYWYHKHTVHVRKSVYAYQINPRTWKTHAKKVLKKNTRITVYNSANLSWVVSSSKLHKISGYTWVVKGHYNTNWLKK